MDDTRLLHMSHMIWRFSQWEINSKAVQSEAEKLFWLGCMLVTIFWCWWPKRILVTFFVMLMIFSMWRIGHQHIKWVTKISKLLTDFVSNVHHQHRCTLFDAIIYLAQLVIKSSLDFVSGNLAPRGSRSLDFVSGICGKGFEKNFHLKLDCSHGILSWSNRRFEWYHPDHQQRTLPARA